MAVLGVDGCPGGWVGARVDENRLSWHTGSFADLLAVPAHVIAVDIPIGLPRDARRRCADLQARKALGAQRSSVLFAPPRVVLEATSHAEATRLSRLAGSVGVSLQTFHVLDKVAEVDTALRSDADAAARNVEVHPEVSLRRLGADRTLPRKRSPGGRDARSAVLRTWLPSLELPLPRPGRARDDDCLDAVAAAWSAQPWLSGHAEVLGGEVDGTGLPMRNVV